VTTLGFLNPKAGAGQSRLILNLGWVLADAGFRVGLVDFDPQAGLTERAGAAGDPRGSSYGALARCIETGGEPDAPELLELEADLWLVRGHILASTFDAHLAAAWAPLAEQRSPALAHGVAHMLAGIIEQAELDVVLCDLGSSLGPFGRVVATSVDAIIVPLAPRAAESAALRGLSITLQRWREAHEDPTGSEPYRTLGFVVVRPSGVVDVTVDQLAAAYQRELRGEHLGTIKEFPSLATIARTVHKPEVELTAADGAAGSLSSAVDDLRRQYEVVATHIGRASGFLDEDVLAERLETVLYSELENELPESLDGLSSHTILDNVSGVEIEAVEIRPGGLRVVGSASVSVTLEYGGGTVRDGLDVEDHFPLRFDLELDRSHESTSVVHHLEVDTSSFYE
jgi:cellulose biosynthesis protein BcsQ